MTKITFLDMNRLRTHDEIVICYCNEGSICVIIKKILTVIHPPPNISDARDGVVEPF